MRAAGLSLKPDARALLIPLLGGDRAASRSELRKLALYAQGRGQDGKQVSVEDIAAVVSDASALALDDIVDAAFAGRTADLETQLGKMRTAGTAAGTLLFTAQRQLAQLHKWRLAIDEQSGFSLDGALPPAQFRRKRAIEAALRSWSAARLVTAMADLAAATLQARQISELADTIAERALLAIAERSRRKAA
jgi:DNA polymerase-3 subunit delta